MSWLSNFHSWLCCFIASSWYRPFIFHKICKWASAGIWKCISYMSFAFYASFGSTTCNPKFLESPLASNRPIQVPHLSMEIPVQNLVLAMTAILALSLPVLSGLIPLWVAVTLHEGSTLLVALNSLRVLYSRYDSPLLGMKSHSQGNSQGVIAWPLLL